MEISFFFKGPLAVSLQIAHTYTETECQRPGHRHPGIKKDGIYDAAGEYQGPILGLMKLSRNQIGV